MVEISDLQVGMRVKVVDEWPLDHYCYAVDDMNRFLGHIVTIREKEPFDVYAMIEEDDCHWAWNKWCFDYIVGDETEVVPPDMSGIFVMLGGK